MKVQSNSNLVKTDNTQSAPAGMSDIMQLLQGAKANATQGTRSMPFPAGQNIQMDNAQFMQDFTQALAAANSEGEQEAQNLSPEQLLAQVKLQLAGLEKNIEGNNKNVAVAPMSAEAKMMLGKQESGENNVSDLTKIIKSTKVNEQQKSNQTTKSDLSLAGSVVAEEGTKESAESKLNKIFTAGMMPARNIKNDADEISPKHINKNENNPNVQNVELMERSRGLKAYGESTPLNAGLIAKRNNNVSVKDEKTKSINFENLSESLLNNNSSTVTNAEATKSVIPSRPVAQVSMNHVPNTAPAFDMSKMNSSQSEQIIEQVTQYLQQSQIRNGKELNLTVNHESLGQFKINARKMKESDGVNLEINTMGDAAHKFFVKHENDLMSKLSLSGVKINDYKLNNSTPQQNASFDSNHQDQPKSAFTPGQLQGDMMNSKNGEQRRKDMWQYYQAYKEGMAA